MLQRDKVKQFVERFYTDHEWRNENTLIVYYPEITITDNHENQHTIYDTYVKFMTITGYLYISVFRAKINLSEIKSRYYHSHISFSDHYGWNESLCFGKVASTFNLYNVSEDKLDAKIINVLLFVDKFLKTESTYTNPYATISLINSSSYFQSKDLKSDTKIIIYPQFLQRVNYNVDNTIKFDDDFKKACVDYYKETSFFYFIKSDDTFLYKNILHGAHRAYYKHSEILFKDKTIQSQTVDDYNTVDDIKWNINPLQLVKIKKEYDKEIERILEKKESLVWEDTRLELPSSRKSIAKLPEESRVFV